MNQNVANENNVEFLAELFRRQIVDLRVAPLHLGIKQLLAELEWPIQDDVVSFFQRIHAKLLHKPLQRPFPVLRQQVPIRDRWQFHRRNVCAASFEFECPEAGRRANVEYSLPAQIGRERKAVNFGSIIVATWRDKSVAKIDRVVPIVAWRFVMSQRWGAFIKRLDRCCEFLLRVPYADSL